MREHEEATCRSIMTLRPVTLQRGDTVATGLRMLVQHRQLGIPVVEPDGRYYGMFVKSGLIAALLPKVIQAENHLKALGQTVNVGYVSENLEDIQARLAAIAGDRVDRHVATDAPILRPESSLIDALVALHRARNFVPVVETSGKLVGIVSTWDALALIGRLV